jgi:hypothetical protein
LLDLDAILSCSPWPIGVGGVENRRGRPLAVLFFGAGFAQAVNAVLRTQQGHYVDVVYLMSTVWRALFRITDVQPITSMEACAALLAFCRVCLALLVRKVRAYKIVR